MTVGAVELLQHLSGQALAAKDVAELRMGRGGIGVEQPDEPPGGIDLASEKTARRSPIHLYNAAPVMLFRFGKKGPEPLRKLRENPPPRVVLCLGLKSSGSTWLYNVAIRILKEAHPGKGAVRAFFADNSAMIPKGAEKAQVLVIKSHEPSTAILFFTRFARGQVLVTVREPRDSVASLMLRFGHSFESALKDVREGGKHVMALARSGGGWCCVTKDGFPDKERTVDEVAAFLGVKISRACATASSARSPREAVQKKIKTLHSGVTDPNAFDPTTPVASRPCRRRAHRQVQIGAQRRTAKTDSGRDKGLRPEIRLHPAAEEIGPGGDPGRTAHRGC